MKEKAVLKKNKDMVTRVIDEETILLPIYKTSEEINCIYTLNKSASRIWEMIDGKRNMAAVLKQLLKEFDTTLPEAERELAKVVRELKEIKAIA